jgi:hypothetical protein
MTTATQNVNSEREAYIQSKMDEFKKREATLQGRKISYFGDQTKKNAEWWGMCQFYTMIAVFALIMVGLIAIAIVAGLGLLI